MRSIITPGESSGSESSSLDPGIEARQRELIRRFNLKIIGDRVHMGFELRSSEMRALFNTRPIEAVQRMFGTLERQVNRLLDESNDYLGTVKD